MWDQQDYEAAMALQGKVSLRMAEIKTGVPDSTIKRWWKGVRPRHQFLAEEKGKPRPERVLTHCRRGHKFTKSNTHWHMIGDSRRRTCKLCRKATLRRFEYRRSYRYHPVYNPDPMLAPLTQLWYRTEDVRDLVLSHYDEGSVSSPLDSSGRDYRRWKGIHCLESTYTRADIVDKLLTKLRVPMVELPDPLHSPKAPSEEIAA